MKRGIVSSFVLVVAAPVVGTSSSLRRTSGPFRDILSKEF
jgi:hypothetical protein